MASNLSPQTVRRAIEKATAALDTGGEVDLDKLRGLYAETRALAMRWEKEARACQGTLRVSRLREASERYAQWVRWRNRLLHVIGRAVNGVDGGEEI